MKKKQRVRLSVLAIRTKNMLFYLLSGVLFVLISSYLFALNHIAFRGYVFQEQLAQNQNLSEKVAQLDNKLTNLQTQENLDKQITKYQLVPKEKARFVIIRQNFTARK